MKKKILTILVLTVVTMLPVVAGASVDKKQTQQQRLAKIEKYIAQRRQEIENHYRDQLTELRLRADAEIRKLEVADKGIYSSLAAQAKIAETVLHINDYEYSRRSYECDSHRGLQNTIDKAPERFAIAQSRIAEEKTDILAKLEHEVLRLEKGKRYALTVGIANLENRLKENVLKPEPEPTHGIVTGIVYSADKPSAVIDGKIVYEGNTIHGVKIVKIHRDNVEFGHDSNAWKQKTGQTAKKFWQ